jgi:hypothetical protein
MDLAGWIDFVDGVMFVICVELVLLWILQDWYEIKVSRK